MARSKKQKVSIVVPCFNEEKVLDKLYIEVSKVFKSLKSVTFELIFVDDGSKDNTLGMIKTLRKKDKKIKFVSFSRNFGKEAAMYAGLEVSDGDFVAIMDADLQDPPNLLPEMLNILTAPESAYDCVATRRSDRAGEPKIRSFFARKFYKLMNRVSSVELVDGARDYRLMTRKMVNEVLKLKEYNRFSKGLFAFVGFKTKWLSYENIERIDGETKWSFWKLFKYAIDGIVAFSDIPLTLASLFGLLFCVISFFMIIVIIIKTLIFGDPTSGWPSMICIIFLVSGVQLFCLGIIGKYLANIYLETKKRPIYIVDEIETNE